MAGKASEQDDRIQTLEHEVDRLRNNQRELIKALIQILPSDHAQHVLRNLRQE